MSALNRIAFETALRSGIRGEVSTDATTLGIYSTDASNYQIQPVAVVTPLDDDDVRHAVRTAGEFGITILPRGGGTSLAGQTVGESVVIDFSRHMNAVLELNVEERWIRVQPGLVRDELNALVAEHGLQFAPDPATANRANVGGMIGNNSSGTRSIIYGKTIDHVIALKTLLADGTICTFERMTAADRDQRIADESREGELLGGLKAIIDEHRDEIRERFPKVMRRVGGYNLDEFVDTDDWNLAKLLVGSEGTLALQLEATLNLEPLPASAILCVPHFRDLLEAIRAVELAVEHGPSAVEILDQAVIRLARENLSTAPLCEFIEGDPAAILIIEFQGDSPEQVRGKAIALTAALQGRDHGYAWPSLIDAESQARVWNVRKNGLGLMLGMKGARKPLPFIEDAAIPLEVLPEYIDRVLGICRQLGVEVAMYAHASVGVIHVRPILDLRSRQDIDLMKAIAEQTFALVVEYGGSWSGEHGDGLVRSPFMAEFFGPRLYQAFKRVKALFDPQWIMNPGKIVDAEPMDKNLRYGTGYRLETFSTLFKYRQDGDFAAAVEMCSGVGACRKTLAGTMCPSYMVTRDEEHTTRGRANALRLAMTGQLGANGLTSQRLHDVLDLCLSCKACKSECPSNVDMAKLKSESLRMHYDKHGTRLRDRLVRDSAATANRISGRLAPWVNRVQGTQWFRGLLAKIVGIAPERVLPDYADEPLARWLENRPRVVDGDRGRVALFCDTYMSHYEPRVGRAAVELLESCDYEVVPVFAGCCQRPRLSHGFLREAKKDGETTLRALDRHIQDGLKVVCCEPSCASALTDDLPDLIDDEALADRVASNVMMIDVFLATELANGRLDCEFEPLVKGALLHGHCHQKSLYGTATMKSILGASAGVDVVEVDSGCCGMAGSFGYEKEHYDVSMKMGERRLFPAVRDCDEDTSVVACGFSCRHQIEHGAGRRALHWVETVRGVPRGAAE